MTTNANAIPDPPIRPQELSYWAFQLPVRAPVPAGHVNPIDAFVMKVLDEKGIKQAPQADRITLLRRAYLDLIGLPPTPPKPTNF